MPPESNERQFGPYRLIHQIATGGMAEIFLAKTKGVGGFEKYIALKMIHPNFSSDEHFIQMLIDEAKISVQLQHVNIAHIFDLGRVDDTYYIAMEYVDGCDLYRILRKASEKDIAMPIDIAVYVAKEVCAGLDYAHRKRDSSGRSMGIVHRDISPQNILLSTAGEAKIVDFGIAKATMRARQTAAGVIKGKYYYMSPEQAWGDAVDARSDIFSAGILLYEMLTGQMLYLEEDITKLLDMVRKANIPPPSTKRPDIPRELDRIVMKALAKKPEVRWQNAHDFGGALERFLLTMSPDFTSARLAAFVTQVMGDNPAPSTALPLRAAGAPPAKLSSDAKRVTKGLGREAIMSRGEFADENSIIFSGPDGPIARPAPEKPAAPRRSPTATAPPKPTASPSKLPLPAPQQKAPAPAAKPAVRAPGTPSATMRMAAVVPPPAAAPVPKAPPPVVAKPAAVTPPPAKPLVTPGTPATAARPASPLRKHQLDTPHLNLPPEGEERTFVTGPPGFGAPAEGGTIDIPDGMLVPMEGDPASTGDFTADRPLPGPAPAPTVLPAAPPPKVTAPPARPPSDPLDHDHDEPTQIDGPAIHSNAPQSIAAGTETVRRVTSRPPPTPTRPPPSPTGSRTPPPMPAQRPPSVEIDDSIHEPSEMHDEPADLAPPPPPPPRRGPATLPLAAPPEPIVSRRAPPVEEPAWQSAAAEPPGWVSPGEDLSMQYRISHRSSPQSDRRWFWVVLLGVGAAVAGIAVFVAVNSRPPPIVPTGAFEIISIPVGGHLRVDGADSGTTPKTIDGLALGRKLKLRVDLDHYDTWERDEVVTEGRQVKIIASLTPIEGALHITSNPPGAEVFFNNQSLGRTPLDKPDMDPFVDGVIEVRKTGFKPSRQPLTWAGQRNADLKFDLLPTRE